MQGGQGKLKCTHTVSWKNLVEENLWKRKTPERMILKYTLKEKYCGAWALVRSMACSGAELLFGTVTFGFTRAQIFFTL
jgi:hypothetical protein